MDRPIKLYEFLIGLISLVTALLVSGYNIGSMQGKINTRQAQQDLKISQIESRVAGVENAVTSSADKTGNKIDEMRKDITEIKILLQNKQDRQ